MPLATFGFGTSNILKYFESKYQEQINQKQYIIIKKLSNMKSKKNVVAGLGEIGNPILKLFSKYDNLSFEHGNLSFFKLVNIIFFVAV